MQPIDKTVQSRTDSDIGILNDLIQICLDGEESFGQACDATRDRLLQDLFLKQAAERAAFVEELAGEVEKIGGIPRRSVRLSGVAHRIWIDLKTSVTNRDPLWILKECGREEASAVAAYKLALARLSSDHLNIVARQYAAIQQTYRDLLAQWMIPNHPDTGFAYSGSARRLDS